MESFFSVNAGKSNYWSTKIRLCLGFLQFDNQGKYFVDQNRLKKKVQQRNKLKKKHVKKDFLVLCHLVFASFDNFADFFQVKMSKQYY